MKKYLFSFILVNLLSACGFIHTPFDSPAPKKENASATETPKPDAAKVESATTPEVSAKNLENPAEPETASAADAPKAEATTTTDSAPLIADVSPQADATPPVPEPNTEPVAAPAPKAETIDPLNDPAGALSKRSIHFQFDSDVIQTVDKPTVAAHGAYLAGHLERKIRVTGNTDERGSSEYNLALGQRRASNAKKALVLSGAKSSQIEAISLGEEKPLATGHDEASWAENRRVDITYK